MYVMLFKTLSESTNLPKFSQSPMSYASARESLDNYSSHCVVVLSEES